MNLTDSMGVDAARVASAFNVGADVYNRIDWNIVGPCLALFLIIATMIALNWNVVKFFWAKTPFARWRERQRMRAEREKKLREMVADYVTDALEEAYGEGDISLEEKSLIYRRIGKLGYTDLLKRGELSLREEITKRRAAEPRDSDGKVIPIKLPGEEAPTKKRKQAAHVHVL